MATQMKPALTGSWTLVAAGLLCVVFRPAVCGCPGGMQLFEGSCWSLEMTAANFDTARVTCQSRPGGDLAPVTNRRIQDKFQNMVDVEPSITASTDERFWIGLRRASTSNPYTWVMPGITSQTYSHWLDHFNDTLDEPMDDDGWLCAAFLHLPTEEGATNVTDFLYGWAAWDCNKVHPYFCRAPVSPGECSLPLMSGDTSLPVSAVTSSSTAVVDGVSSLDDFLLGTQVGLDNHEVGAWITEDLHSLDYYIQVDLQQPRIVRQVWTQGRHDPNDTWRQWTRSYYVDYSTDQSTWTRYGYPQSEDVPQLLKGNSDSNTEVKRTLDWPFYARYVRLTPIGHRNAMALRWELAGCPLPAAADTNLGLGQAPFIHRTDHYRTYGADIDENLAYLTDGTDTTCKTIPSAEFHPAWPFHVRIPLTVAVHYAVVTVIGKNLPCKQNFGSKKMWGIASVHSHDDVTIETSFSGKFRHCTLLTDTRSAASPDVTCQFMCARNPTSITVGHVFVSVEETPTEPDEAKKWSICEVKVQQTV